MASWRCPYCGSAQTETARCWVCRRSTTSCGSCVHFRSSVAGRLGYCALDRRHDPLTGYEERGCWVGADSPAGPASPRSTAAAPAEGDLWSLLPAAPAEQAPPPRAPEHPPDGTVRSTGMWAEAQDGTRVAVPASNAGSIRAQPWGRAPGREEARARLRDLRRLRPG